MRHEPNKFSSWWCISRDRNLPRSVNDSVDINGIRSSTWDVAVYVKSNVFSSKLLRGSVLASCGGQHKVHCAQHKLPLITCPEKNFRSCSCGKGALPTLSQSLESRGDLILPSNSCNRKAIFCCSVSDCASAICKNHHAEVLDLQYKFYVGEACFYGDRSDFEEEPGFDESGIPFFHMEEDESHEDIPNCDTISDTSPEYDSPLYLNDEDVMESAFNIAENEDSGDFVTDGREGLDDFCFNEEDSMNSEQSCRGFLNDPVPTTNSGRTPIFSDLVSETYKNASMSNHVLLNNYGHMLIRRNVKLQGSMKQRHFLQRLVSAFPGRSIPLVYPEGMLFPDIFYADDGENNILGAIPAVLLHDPSWLSRNGFQSLESHFKSRLSNANLMTAGNPKYHFFVFDTMSNLGLRGCDTRLVLSRGFAELQGTGGVKFRGVDDLIFDTEHVDGRDTVNKVSAFVAQQKVAYFVTHTLSMGTHFGIKIIWDWLVSDDLLRIVCDGTESEEERSLLQEALINSAGVLLLRSWMEMAHVWLDYITKSPEEPIGKVTQYVFRFELQDGDKPHSKQRANLPHIHGLICTADNLASPEGLHAVLDRIRGFVIDIIRPEECHGYMEQGIFKDDDDIVRFQELAQSFLCHKHDRRCTITVPDIENGTTTRLRCKANDNFKMNPSPGEHTFIDVPITHSEDSLTVMCELELARIDGDGKFVPLHSSLESKKHCPPAHGDEGIIQPVFGSLFARNPNMGNVQHPTNYTLSRYLTKYILSRDKCNVVTINAPLPGKVSDVVAYRVSAEELPNQKITGNRIAEQKRQGSQAQKGAAQQGRAINVSEFYMMLYGYKPVLTNVKFVKVVSKPPEERAARERKKPLDRLKNEPTLQGQALTVLNCIPSHNVRTMLSLPDRRQFTTSQLDMLFDDLDSPLTTSSVTIFSVRPPELRFVMQQNQYFRWFDRDQIGGDIETKLKYCETSMSNCFEKSA
jgi:hypothetical protein